MYSELDGRPQAVGLDDDVQEMTAALGTFLDYYRDTINRYLASVPEDWLAEFADRLTAAITGGGNTLYFFGNGGSHAISRHFEYALRHRLRGVQPVRVNSGADFHLGQYHAAMHGFNSIFESILDSEQGGARDFSVLISGSGDSDNLLHAARYCRAKGVRTVSFAGFDGGKISLPGRTELAFVVRVHDQQLSEDIIQVLLHAAAELTYRRCLGRPIAGGPVVKAYAERIAAGLRRISPEFMERVSRGVCEAFLAERDVFLLTPEGAPISFSAEHIAHNLNWDAVYQVPHPPRRRLHSTPTLCDYTGIGNDRTAAGVVSRQQLDRARPGDVLILFARSLAADTVQITLEHARSIGLSVYVVTGDAESEDPDTLAFGTDSAEVIADCGQSFGHMLGRISRMRLLRAVDPEGYIGDPAKYLIGNDLAQRRLINSVCGV